MWLSFVDHDKMINVQVWLFMLYLMLLEASLCCEKHCGLTLKSYAPSTPEECQEGVQSQGGHGQQIEEHQDVHYDQVEHFKWQF